MYEYKCMTVRVVDGNTIDAEIDLGFNVLVEQRIKLFGVNVPDMRSYKEEDKDRAIKARDRLLVLLGNEFICQTMLNKRGKTGRTLGQVYVMDINGQRIDVNQTLIDEGFASKFGE